MQTDLPKEVFDIMNKFTEAGYQIYIVGGAIRDLIIGRPVKEWDFTTDAKPEQILKLFPDGFYENNFGTVGVSFPVIPSISEESQDSNLEIATSPSAPRNDKVEVYEITTMRKEGDYQDSRHPSEISWTNKIEEDLARRDFSINAIALGKPSTSSGNILRANAESRGDTEFMLIDPFQGQQDIKNKTIRAVGDPNKRFQEDALRLMRAIRIATQLEFKIEDQTFASIKQNANLITKISYERIRDELFKLLASDNPLLGILKLREAGILPIILPELERCFGIVQEGPKHDRVYEIGQHSLLSLKFCTSTDPLVRFATLLHDVGKPDTIHTQPDGNVTFYNHDLVGGKISLQIANRFKLSKKQTDKFYRLVRRHLFTVDENQTDSAIRRFIKNVGIENIDDMMALRIGDRLGGGTQKAISWRMEKFRERIDQVLEKPFSINDLKINGNDVMQELKLKPGPQIGQILQQLFEEVLEDASKNNREYLFERIKQI